MRSISLPGATWTRLLVPVLCWIASAPLSSHAADTSVTNHPVLILEIEGTVEVMRAGAGAWDKATITPPYNTLRPGDQLRTGNKSRATVRLSNLTVSRLDKNSLLRIPEQKKEGAFFEFVRGIMYFFHRDKPGEFDVDTPRVSAVIRGTEFNLRVDDDGTTTLTLFDGEVTMTNALGSLTMTSGQEAVVRPDAPPERTASIFTVNTVQWCLYYPGILNPADLNLTPAETAALEPSLAAYQSGDIPQALRLYPADRQPSSHADACYHAALLLSVGDVAGGEALLRGVDAGADPSDPARRIASALRQLIAAIQFRAYDPARPSELATEWMAESYYEQSRSRLDLALGAARRAGAVAPEFAFAQSRVAELEFGFGRVDPALNAVDRSLDLAPRNAEAMVLRGFLAAAQNRLNEAGDYFDRAQAIDGALGNAWLGRGLVDMRQGRVLEGLDAIQVAAVLEPQRALFRSYLGKAYSRAGDDTRASSELGLAIRLDPQDPTPWMYSALVNRQQNRINEAVGNLEQAQDLNATRGLYRSQPLLDQDLAVRSANLANVYTDVGMNEMGLREASRSVNASYANFSGHLFLANSYQRLQDPGRISLRYESPAISEYLLANLLAPVGAGTLSPTVSQQEYSKLFTSDGMGLVSSTEYLSRGAWTQNGAIYGTFGNAAFSFASTHIEDNGQRRNNDLELDSYALSWKQQVTPQDTVFAQVLWSDGESGDVAPRFNPNHVNPAVRVTETQDPILLAGYHHEWTPESHTLFLATRLDDTLKVTDPFQSTTLIAKDASGQVIAVRDLLTDQSPVSIDQDYQSEMTMFSAEAQHILERGNHTLIAGTRFQSGDFDTDNRHTPTDSSFVSPGSQSFFTGLDQSSHEAFFRGGVYAYHQWQVADPLMLVGGVAYDWMRYPSNFRFAPVEDDESTEDQISPKAGFVLTPTATTSLQGSYTRGLGGASFERSFSIEPSQVAGLNQSFRSVMPDAVTGANTAESYDQYTAAFSQKLPTRTYIDLVGQFLRSDSDRDIGVYDVLPPAVGVFPLPPFIFPGQTRQSLDYHEQSLGVVVNQLVGRDWAFGAGYQFTKADLSVEYEDVPDDAVLFEGFQIKQNLKSYLHHVKLFGIYNHPCGFFAEVQSLWFQQSNRDSRFETDGDDFWQFNAFAGYRLFQRRAEITVGVLNVTDQNYRLGPMNLSPNLARERTFAARFRISL